MNKNYLIAFFCIFLIVCIPVSVSDAYAVTTKDPVEEKKEEQRPELIIVEVTGYAPDILTVNLLEQDDQIVFANLEGLLSNPLEGDLQIESVEIANKETIDPRWEPLVKSITHVAPVSYEKIQHDLLPGTIDLGQAKITLHRIDNLKQKEEANKTRKETKKELGSTEKELTETITADTESFIEAVNSWLETNTPKQINQTNKTTGETKTILTKSNISKTILNQISAQLDKLRSSLSSNSTSKMSNEMTAMRTLAAKADKTLYNKLVEIQSKSSASKLKATQTRLLEYKIEDIPDHIDINTTFKIKYKYLEGGAFSQDLKGLEVTKNEEIENIVGVTGNKNSFYEDRFWLIVDKIDENKNTVTFSIYRMNPKDGKLEKRTTKTLKVKETASEWVLPTDMKLDDKVLTFFLSNINSGSSEELIANIKVNVKSDRLKEVYKDRDEFSITDKNLDAGLCYSGTKDNGELIIYKQKFSIKSIDKEHNEVSVERSFDTSKEANNLLKDYGVTGTPTKDNSLGLELCKADTEILSKDNSVISFGQVTLKLDSIISPGASADIEIRPGKKESYSYSNVILKVSIEKRADFLKPTPEQLNKRIQNTRRTIEKLTNIINQIETVTDVWLRACEVTMLVLTVKSFFEGLTGKTLVRGVVDKQAHESYKLECENTGSKDPQCKNYLSYYDYYNKKNPGLMDKYSKRLNVLEDACKGSKDFDSCLNENYGGKYKSLDEILTKEFNEDNSLKHPLKTPTGEVIFNTYINSLKNKIEGTLSSITGWIVGKGPIATTIDLAFTESDYNLEVDIQKESIENESCTNPTSITIGYTINGISSSTPLNQEGDVLIARIGKNVNYKRGFKFQPTKLSVSGYKGEDCPKEFKTFSSADFETGKLYYVIQTDYETKEEVKGTLTTETSESGRTRVKEFIVTKKIAREKNLGNIRKITAHYNPDGSLKSIDVESEDDCTSSGLAIEAISLMYVNYQKDKEAYHCAPFYKSAYALMDQISEKGEDSLQEFLKNNPDYTTEAVGALETSAECTAVMSRTDCEILFRVCDPVICPPSRCNAANIKVDNVIQSGLIGSLILCIPAQTVCLTGVLASLKAIRSVFQSYLNCLVNAKAGKNEIGICDKLQSIFICQIVWDSIIPLLSSGLWPWISKNIFRSKYGAGEGHFLDKGSIDASKNSLSYMTQTYGRNVFSAFRTKSTKELGTELCERMIYGKMPGLSDFLDEMTAGTNPPQFLARIDTAPYTGQSRGEASKYNTAYQVFYHIYAGSTEIEYTIFLRGAISSEGRQLDPLSIIPRDEQGHTSKGKLPAEGYATETVDIAGSAGYDEICVVINGVQRCGFKTVSSDYTANSMNQYFIEKEKRKEIKSSADCVPTTDGIVRACSLFNPGQSVTNKWVQVGTCGRDKDGKDLGDCWMDTESIKSDQSQDKFYSSKTCKDITGSDNYLCDLNKGETCAGGPNAHWVESGDSQQGGFRCCKDGQCIGSLDYNSSSGITKFFDSKEGGLNETKENDCLSVESLYNSNLKEGQELSKTQNLNLGICYYNLAHEQRLKISETTDESKKSNYKEGFDNSISKAVGYLEGSTGSGARYYLASCYLEKAVVSEKKSNYEEAKKIFEEELIKDSNKDIACKSEYQLALCYQGLEDYDSATIHAQEALDCGERQAGLLLSELGEKGEASSGKVLSDIESRTTNNDCSRAEEVYKKDGSKLSENDQKKAVTIIIKCWNNKIEKEGTVEYSTSAQYLLEFVALTEPKPPIEEFVNNVPELRYYVTRARVMSEDTDLEKDIEQIKKDYNDNKPSKTESADQINFEIAVAYLRTAKKILDKTNSTLKDSEAFLNEAKKSFEDYKGELDASYCTSKIKSNCLDELENEGGKKTCTDSLDQNQVKQRCLILPKAANF